MSKVDILTAMNGAANIVTVVGMDLARKVFALHGIDAAGKPA